MAGFLINCFLSTQRAQPTGTGGTTAPTPYLSGIPGCIQAMTANDYRLSPEASLETLYVVTCWPDAQGAFPDIHMNDLVTIYEKDGVTQWPGENPNEVFIATLTRKIVPQSLPHMKVFVGRYTAGGPIYTG